MPDSPAAGAGNPFWSILGAGSAAFPPLAIAQAAGGALQGVAGYIQSRRAQKQLENLKSPTYTPSSSILDYYNKAVARYNQNPYETNLYKMQNQNIQRGTAQGLNTLSQGRGAIAGVSNLIQGQNDALLKAGAAAEGQQAQALGQLGQAAGAKANEMNKVFQYNQLAPYQNRFNLLASKISGGNQLLNSGLSNIFGAGNTQQQYQMINKIYGQ